MEAKTVHTATPWSYKQLTGAARGYALFWSDNSKPVTWQRRVDQYSNIGPNGEFTEQDAAFIVRACNSFDDLLAALKDAEQIISTTLREGQLRDETEPQKQNIFNVTSLIGGIRAALYNAEAT